MDDLALLMDMQHYSCPTRLIDWSTSPYVALYFSISENLDKDSSLFIWNYNLYTSSVKRKYSQFNDLGFKELIDFKEFDHVQILLPMKKNERLYKQQGVFSSSNNLLKSHCEIINNLSSSLSCESSLTKLIIPHEIKLDFLDRLRYMNITANTLFPCLDGIGREIKESLLLRKWKEKINFGEQ